MDSVLHVIVSYESWGIIELFALFPSFVIFAKICYDNSVKL